MDHRVLYFKRAIRLTCSHSIKNGANKWKGKKSFQLEPVKGVCVGGRSIMPAYDYQIVDLFEWVCVSVRPVGVSCTQMCILCHFGILTVWKNIRFAY